MNRIRQTISVALVLAMVSLGLVTAEAQRRPYRMTDRQVGDIIRRVETSTDRFRASLDSSLDRGRLDGTNAEDNINGFVQSFEQATDRLRNRFNTRASVAADVEFVLQQAVAIDRFMTANRLTRRAQSDWQLVRTDLDALARAYSVAWNWSSPVMGGGVVGGVPVRVNDREVGVIIGRIETRTDSFRSALDRALDRGRFDGTRAEDNINQFIQNFEQSTDLLRSRFNSRNAATSDVENVLRQAAFIDDFMRRNRVGNRPETEWQQLRTDLNALASAYNVAWNWTTPLPPYGGGVGTSPVYAAGLTGTYRLDASRSDNSATVVERATRNLPVNQRQRVSENIMQRLEAPDTLAIDRRGNSVTIASSRAPQTTFVADGRETREQLPNGGFSRVSAQLAGERLVVRSAGDRATDFNVTFEPINGGRQLRVTREIWNDRVGASPIVVQNVYDRTSDVADFNVYGGGGVYSDSVGTAAGDYAIGNGQILVATLNNNLTTRDTQVGDRFTMTVRDPAQYQGAVIEGRVASVGRSGRVTGRSEISLNFDTIRLRDGRTHQFAGFIESVRTANGESVQIDNEGGVRDDDSRGSTTAQRAAIGTAVGAIIGAIAGGGKGAAIGAIIGAAGGAGSVYVQGRDDLELLNGTEVTIRASAPNR